MHTRAYRQGCDRIIKYQHREKGEGVGGQDGRGGRKRGNKPDYHNLPFVKTTLIDESFAKMAIRPGALEGSQEYGGVRTGRKALNRMFG